MLGEECEAPGGTFQPGLQSLVWCGVLGRKERTSCLMFTLTLTRKLSSDFMSINQHSVILVLLFLFFLNVQIVLFFNLIF